MTKLEGSAYYNRTSEENWPYEIYVDEYGHFYARIPEDANVDACAIFKMANIESGYSNSRSELIDSVDEKLQSYFSKKAKISRVLLVQANMKSSEGGESVSGPVSLELLRAKSKEGFLGAEVDLEVIRGFKVTFDGWSRYFGFDYRDGLSRRISVTSKLEKLGYYCAIGYNKKREFHTPLAQSLLDSGQAVAVPGFNSYAVLPSYTSKHVMDYVFIHENMLRIGDSKQYHIEAYSEEAWQTLSVLVARLFEVQTAIQQFLTPKKGLTLLETFQTRKTPFMLNAKPEDTAE